MQEMAGIWLPGLHCLAIPQIPFLINRRSELAWKIKKKKKENSNKLQRKDEKETVESDRMG